MSESTTVQRIRASKSESFRRLNPELFGLGPVDPQVHSKPKGALVSEVSPEPSRKRSLCKGHSLTVTLTAYLPRRMDPDNLGTSLKPLQDAISDWLKLDDGDPRLRWEYGQVETRGAKGVLIAVSL